MEASRIRSNAPIVKDGAATTPLVKPANDDLPAPLYSADIDLTPLPRMWFDPRQMLREDWLYELPAEAVRAQFILRMTSFHEVPAGSVPDRDGALQRMCGMDRATWQAIKADALSGWTLCSDGRWYCRDMEAQVLEASGRRAEKAKQLAQARENKAKKKASSDASTEISSDVRDEVSPEAKPVVALNTTTTTTANTNVGSRKTESASTAAGRPSKSKWHGFQEDDRAHPGKDINGVWLSLVRIAGWRKQYPSVPESAYLGKIGWLKSKRPSEPLFEKLEELIANEQTKLVQEIEIEKAKEAVRAIAPKSKPPLV